MPALSAHPEIQTVAEKANSHLAFLGKEPEEVASESVLVCAAETYWQTDWPWRPQPEPAELKCMKKGPSGLSSMGHGTVLFTLRGHPYSCLGKKEAFFNSFSLSTLLDTTVKGLA